MKNGRMSATCIPNRILICTIYKELTKLDALKLIYEYANELNKQFSEEEIQIASKYMKNVSLAIRNMQIDTTLRFTSHSSQNGYHEENKQQKNTGKNVREEEPFYNADENIK